MSLPPALEEHHRYSPETTIAACKGSDEDVEDYMNRKSRKQEAEVSILILITITRHCKRVTTERKRRRRRRGSDITSMLRLQHPSNLNIFKERDKYILYSS